MSKLQQHFMKEHDLMLLDSEINDILELARQEIELPDYEELKEYRDKEFESAKALGQSDADMYALGIEVGGVWMLNKVRNPYPKPMNLNNVYGKGTGTHRTPA
jgi:hypothetical protein